MATETHPETSGNSQQGESARKRIFARRRLNPFLLIVSTIMILGYSFIGTQLILPLELSALAQLPIWVLLVLPFAMILWLPLRYWKLDEPTARDDQLLWGAFGSMALLSFLLFFVTLRELLLLGAGIFGMIAGAWHGPGLIGIFAGAAAGWAGGTSRVPMMLLDAHGTWIILGLTLLSLAAGFREARRTPTVTEVQVPIDGLPESLQGLRIAQISDLHIGSTIQRPFVEKVVAAVNAQKPDLIALTGDIIDGTVNQLAPHFEALTGLSAPLGRFYVTGNHEYYWEHEAWIAHVRSKGFTALTNSHAVIERGGAKIVVAGVLDFWAERNGGKEASSPSAALAGAPKDAAARILLAHQPKSALEATTLGYDLQLSGHTHGGQFLPWTVAVHGVQPFVRGLYRVGKMWLYVNRGTGYWGPPVRLGSPSEITLLTLVRS
jgi:predicted MPP superfamily phosphohydrolase